MKYLLVKVESQRPILCYKKWLSNLEVLNASMIENNISKSQKIEKLNETARKEEFYSFSCFYV